TPERKTKRPGEVARPFVAERKNRAANSGLSRDAIEDLGLLVVLLLLFLLGSREVGAEHGVLGLLLSAVLFLLFLLGSGKVGADYGVIGLLLHAVLFLLFLLGSREVSAEHGVLGLLLRAVLFLLFLLGSGEISAEHSILGLLLHAVFLLFLLLGGRQVVALNDALDGRSRERRQAHRSEEAERDGDCSNLAHCVCPLGSIH